CSSAPATQCLTTQDCPKVGQCNNQGNACQNDADCLSIPGACSILTNISCTPPPVGGSSVCVPVGKCSVTQAQCTSNANCPNIPGPLPPNAAVCSTGGVGGVATATLFNDANTASKGVACRHN